MATDNRGDVPKTYAGQGYNPTYLARKFKISKPRARELIRKVGHDRDKLNEAAAKICD